MISALIFDADDTLWETEILYDQALDRTQAEIERLGLPGPEWRRRQREIDLEQVKDMGFSLNRFPSSSVLAYRQIIDRPDAAVENRIFELSASVFTTKAELMPGVADVLDDMSGQYQLAVITKGENSLQRRRLDESGLSRFFDASVVVAHKTPATFRAMCDLMEVEPARTVSIGNSLKSDILPAVEAGLAGIWIDAAVWEHEHHDAENLPENVFKLPSLTALDEVLVT